MRLFRGVAFKLGKQLDRFEKCVIQSKVVPKLVGELSHFDMISQILEDGDCLPRRGIVVWGSVHCRTCVSSATCERWPKSA